MMDDGSPVVAAKSHPSLDESRAAVDPFFSTSTSSAHHRFSNFDSQMFANGSTSSPEQAKRALEAHLAETDRRIQEASKLGTTLVDQRTELSERLKEVEQQRSEGDITPELRQKLVEIEREYNEVGRESARAFLPKSRVSSNELGNGSPIRNHSPSKFESQATASPSKLSVPNRKQRNQSSNRVHDIEFATEISTSLLSQVRNLQTLLAEKEESLRVVTLDKSKLEAEAEGFHQRLRSLDESENRYKDENWSLETQIHEHIASSKDAADREKKLTQALNVTQSEKTAAQKELDEIKSNHTKLADDHAALIKQHDVEFGGVRRNMAMIETEKGALQRKIEELKSQNQELAVAMAHFRARADDNNQKGMSDEDFVTADDNQTSEGSPPQSPIKATPRHSMLESETLKSSLGHAHRMIQSLKGNIHREKTEKLELKRMLQEARDELDVKRSEATMGVSSQRKLRKNDSAQFKKPLKPGQLGTQRSSQSEVFMDDPNWEDHEQSPTQSPQSAAIIAARVATGTADHRGTPGATRMAEVNDRYDTANDASDAFETANERGTETEDFHTGNEDVSGSDELTETEDTVQSTSRVKRPSVLSLKQAGNRESYRSTASDDEYDFGDSRTPVLSQPQRMRLKLGRAGARHSRINSEDQSYGSSPPGTADSSKSYGSSPPGTADSSNSTPNTGNRQSLFAELEDLDGEFDDDESVEGTPTPSKKSFGSRPSTSYTETPTRRPFSSGRGVAPVLLPKMVDSGMMTEDWEPAQAVVSEDSHLSTIAAAGLAGAGLAGAAVHARNKHLSTVSTAPSLSDEASQWHADQLGNLLTVEQRSRPISTSVYSDMSSQYDQDIDERLARFPSPPLSPAHPSTSSPPATQAVAPPLAISGILSEHTEPSPVVDAVPIFEVAPAQPVTPVTPILGFSTIQFVQTEPIEPIESPPPRSPRRDGMIIPRDPSIDDLASQEVRQETPVIPISNSAARDIKLESPATPKSGIFGSVFSWGSNKKTPTTPIATEEEIPKKHLPATPATPDAPTVARDGDSSIILQTPIVATGETSKAAISSSAAVENETINNSLGAPVVVKEESQRKVPSTPVIAEDETRQSISESPVMGTPESQRPFRETSGNAKERAVRVPKAFMSDVSSQTALTSAEIENMLSSKMAQPRTITTAGLAAAHPSSPTSPTSPSSPQRLPNTSALRVRKSQESFGSVGRARAKMMEPDFVHDTAVVKRPGSSGSTKGSISSSHPPLPSDHRQVIAAAASRGGSSSGGQPSSNGGAGTMGPPVLPASAYKSNPSFRPRTPSQVPPSPGSVRAATPSRAGSSFGNAQVYAPTGVTGRSRQSSVSSFASEVDSRFNLKNGLPMPQGFEGGTDPRMIQAITQTMIGEYLWKYTRKPGRVEMSDNRHRRYFWVHPYTRTLYWSDRDPAQAGRAELKAKSVAIEAVRVVTDDNPMPPGLHRKSLIIISPGRSIKFTATTGQRHETWFNALSYLLLRTEDAGADTESVANGLTREDVDEFNPGFGRSVNRPGSLSSYNSRTNRNESPARRSLRMSMQTPTLQHPAIRGSPGTFSRLSSYWKPKDGATPSISSKKSRFAGSHHNGSFYQTSEAHDSAEDVREMIEQQDRDSDRLENVRACCDGKHDVGHLHHHSSKKGRHSQTGSGNPPSTATSRLRGAPSIPESAAENAS